MNFSKRQNEFCDIPGFGASKGERIVKALQKLWTKIQNLEQSRTLEKKSGAEASCSSKEDDLTLTDVQYKLLLLQLQYVRSFLKKRSCQNFEVPPDKISENKQNYTLPATDKNITREDELYPNTANNFVTGLDFTKESSNMKNKFENVQVTSDNLQFKHSTDKSVAVHQKTVPNSSKPHYHLKLDDVPFILGASSTASHSVVANVQNIIARMKLHNKALCGPKPNATKSASANTHSTTGFIETNYTGEKPKSDTAQSAPVNKQSTNFAEKKYVVENSQDGTNLMLELTRDLRSLAMKQQKMAEIFESEQIKKLGLEISSARETPDIKNKIIYKYLEDGDSKTHRSHSESEVKLHAEVKKIPKTKEKDFVNQSSHPKQSVSNIRSQSSNLSIMERRKLLRSLQSFKKHLSEEDISWN